MGIGGRKEIVGTKRANVLSPRFRLGEAVRKVKQPKRGTLASLQMEGVEKAAKAEIDRASRAAVGAYNDVLMAHFRNVVEAQWPVDTGFSKAQLQITADAVGDTLRMKIENLATYAGYIKQKGATIPHVVKRLMWSHSKRIGDDMMARLRTFIVDGE